MRTIRSLITRLMVAIAATRAAGEVADEALTRGIPEEEPRNPSVRFEPRDVNPRLVLLAGIGVLMGTLAAVLITYPIFRHFTHGAEAVLNLPAARIPPAPPPPRLQQSPRRDLQALRAYEGSRLESYQWIDRAHGVVSIPIEQAIRLTAQRG